MMKFQFRTVRPPPGIGLPSLLNGLTLLLVFFLVGHRNRVVPELPVESSLPLVGTLPEGTPEAELRDSLGIVVTPKTARIGETLFSLETPVTIASLSAALEREMYRDGRNRKQIVLHGDSRVAYGEIDRIVRAAAAVGLTRIRFVAQSGVPR